MFYNPQYFQPCELLPPEIFSLEGETGLYRMDSRILYTLDKLRLKLGPITINNYHIGGEFQQRGFRTDPNVGAVHSPHRYGRAVDFDIQGITAEQFRQAVREGKLNNELFYVTRIEDNVNWIHIDVVGLPRNMDNPIQFFTA